MVPKQKPNTPDEGEPTGAELFDEETANARSLADIAGTGGAMFDGEQATMESLESKKLMVLDYKILPSTFREGGTYVCFQAKVIKTGKLVVVNTNAMVPVKAFAAIEKDALPLEATFFMDEPKKAGGKPYWNIK